MKLTYLMKKSQLHGMNRLSEKKDRVLWLIALPLLFGAAIASMLITLWRYEYSPTFLTRVEHGLYQVDFPAVLICPELDFPIFKMEKFLDSVNIPPPLNKTYLMDVLRQLATYYSPDVRYKETDLENLELLLEHNNIGIEKAVLRLTSTCKEILLRCRWRGRITDCSKLFSMLTMQFGVCCVFNGRSLRMDILSQGLPIKKPTVNVKTKAVGYTSGLSVVVEQKTRKSLRNIDLSYKWVIITSPQRFVESLTVNGTALSPGHEVWCGYKTFALEVTEDSKSLSLGLRRCELSSTRLNYFPLYKRQYCRLECEIRNVLRECNCTMPTHPLPEYTYCKPSAVTCAKNVVRQTNVDNCNCLPNCESNTGETVITTYNFSTKHVPIDDFYLKLPSSDLIGDINYIQQASFYGLPVLSPSKSLIIKLLKYDGLNFEEVTIVRVFVQSRMEAKRTRQPYFTAHDLFAQMGGIFSVFFGCSVLSLLELSQLIIYCIRNWRDTKTSIKNTYTSKSTKIHRDKS